MQYVPYIAPTKFRGHTPPEVELDPTVLTLAADDECLLVLNAPVMIELTARVAATMVTECRTKILLSVPTPDTKGTLTIVACNGTVVYEMTRWCNTHEAMEAKLVRTSLDLGAV